VSYLKLSDPDSKFKVITDASEDVKAISVVLTQSDDPMVFEPKKLNLHMIVIANCSSGLNPLSSKRLSSTARSV
jgi:hypothetical protein